MDETMYYGFYDKTQGKVYNYTQQEMTESLGVGAFSSPVGVTDEGCFVSLLRPSLMRELLAEGRPLDPRLAALAKASGDDDNPILLLYRRK